MEIKKKSVILAVCAVLLVLLGVGIGSFMDGKWGKRYTGLQAVFLTNGQVYFGTIDRMDRGAIHLSGIYYIQRNEQDKTQNDISLTKLGNELHGPEDWMDINRAQVLFIEQLKTDGRVAKAIREYQAQGK